MTSCIIPTNLRLSKQYSHIACEGCSITVLQKDKRPVVEEWVELWVIREESIKAGKWAPVFRGPQIRFAASNTVVLVVTPSPTLHVHNQFVMTVPTTCINKSGSSFSHQTLFAYLVGGSNLEQCHPSTQHPA